MPGFSYKIRTVNVRIMSTLKLMAGCSEGDDESEGSVRGGGACHVVHRKCHMKWARIVSGHPP